jgi:hypothetical protein
MARTLARSGRRRPPVPPHGERRDDRDQADRPQHVGRPTTTRSAPSFAASDTELMPPPDTFEAGPEWLSDGMQAVLDARRR